MELSNYPCLSIGEAVHYYDAPAKQIKRDIKEGKIPAVKIATTKGRRWRIFPSGVPTYIEETLNQQQQSQSQIQELTTRLQELQEQVGALQAQLDKAELAEPILSMAPETAVVPVAEEAVDVIAINLHSDARHPIVQFLNRLLQPLKGQPIQG